jgi:hypothetical protein
MTNGGTTFLCNQFNLQLSITRWMSITSVQLPPVDTLVVLYTAESRIRLSLESDVYHDVAKRAGFMSFTIVSPRTNI